MNEHARFHLSEARRNFREAVRGLFNLGVLIASSTVLSAYRGWVLVSMWCWFVQPLFAAAPVLSMWPAYGLCLLLQAAAGLSSADMRVLQLEHQEERRNPDRGLWELLRTHRYSFGYATTCWLVGYCVHTWGCSP